MSKGTPSMGKMNKFTHVACRRCGKISFHARQKQCSACGFGRSTKMRSYKKDPITASYISSLNETIDLHASRVTALEAAKMPFTIYIGIYLVAVLGLSMLGFQSGLNGTRNFIVTLVLILIFSLVLLVIIDLDRSWGGFLRVKPATNQRFDR